MHTKNASLQLDQSLQAVAQALFADGDAVVVSRLPTAVPAARKAAAEGKRYWDRHGDNLSNKRSLIDFSQNHSPKKIDFFHAGSSRTTRKKSISGQKI